MPWRVNAQAIGEGPITEEPIAEEPIAEEPVCARASGGTPATKAKPHINPPHTNRRIITSQAHVRDVDGSWQYDFIAS
jgi:hypothetical protein